MDRKCILCCQLENMLSKDFILTCNICGHLHSKYDICYCDHTKLGDLKIGVIEKSSFEDKPHMVVNLGDEKIWLEGSFESFDGKKEDYVEGKWIDMIVKRFGTIVGECDFGEIDVLSLYIAEKVRIHVW